MTDVDPPTAEWRRRAPTRPGWLASPWPAATRPTPSRSSHFRRDLVIETKPDRTFVTQADTAIERTIRERIPARYPDHGLVGEEYGTEDGDADRSLVHRPDRRHPQLHARRAAVRHAARGRGGRRDRGRRHDRAPALRRALVRAARRRRVGGRLGRPGRGGAASDRRLAGRGDRRRPDPVRVAATTSRRAARPRASTASSGAVWRDRGFGDFWGYALVAEGAAEAMVEVGPNSWDLAAPSIVVEEAGGRMTDLDGVRSIHGGTRSRRTASCTTRSSKGSEGREATMQERTNPGPPPERPPGAKPAAQRRTRSRHLVQRGP